MPLRRALHDCSETPIADEFDTFDYHAQLLLASVPDELYDDAVELIDDLLADLEDEIDLLVEVFHDEFGEYPSYTRRRYRRLLLPVGVTAYSALFQGTLGDPRLISVGAVDSVADELISQSGIECFCEYGEMLLFLDDELVDDLLDSSGGLTDVAAFWGFVRGNPDSVASRVLQRADVDPTKTIAVGPGEGVVVDEKVTVARFP